MKKLEAREEQKVRMMDWRGTNPRSAIQEPAPRRTGASTSQHAPRPASRSSRPTCNAGTSCGTRALSLPWWRSVREGVLRLDWVGVMRVAGTMR